SVNDSSTSVTGSSTVWRGTIRVGDQIRFNSEVDSTGTALYYTVAAVGSDTSITLDRNKVGTVSGVAYKIRKRRCNRILVLDTRTNLKAIGYNPGWAIFDGVNTDGFCEVENRLFYGSSTSGYVYEYDTGGVLFTAGFSASATTSVTNLGLMNRKKQVLGLMLEAIGSGALTITPYADGVAKTALTHTFGNSTTYEKVFFPRAGQSINFICSEVYGILSVSGSNEDIAISDLRWGFLPLPEGK